MSFSRAFFTHSFFTVNYLCMPTGVSKSSGSWPHGIDHVVSNGTIDYTEFMIDVVKMKNRSSLCFSLEDRLDSAKDLWSDVASNLTSRLHPYICLARLIKPV